MAQFNSLLVALDFRECNAKICQEAIEIAEKMKAEVTLIHVIEYLSYYPYYPYDEEKVYNDLRTEITEKLDKFGALFEKAGVHVNPHIIRKGKTPKVICDCADEINACGIILGLGEHYILENLIGSTADKVTRMAKQAVLLMNTHRREEVFDRILCAYDFSENSERALGSAIYMAKIFNAPLDIVHTIHEHFYYNPAAPVMDPTSPFYTDYVREMDNAKETVSKKIAETLSKLDIEGIQFNVLIRRGEPVNEISKVIDEQHSTLLVIGASGHNAFMRFILGSTTEKLLRKAPCSIMTLKEPH